MMNFLVKYINELFGRGLPYQTVFKLILFNLSWMLALAVPMATLVSVLMAFGRLSADNEITILKSSGISIYRVIRPAIFYGLTLTIIMIYFNDQILPESNHQVSSLFRSIRQKKPTLKLEEHIFFNLGKFTLVVEEIEKPFAEEWLSLNKTLGPEYMANDQIDRLKSVVIFDRSKPGKDITILADEGYMAYSEGRDALVFTLFDGEFHELESQKMSEYRRSDFSKQVVYIPVEGFEFEEQQSNYRSDREMNIAMMQAKVDDYKKQIKKRRERIAQKTTEYFKQLHHLLSDSTRMNADSTISKQLNNASWRDAERRATRESKRRTQQMKNNQSYLKNHNHSINQYEVEIQKKISIPFASIVFVLVGAPLGVMAKKGSKGVAISMSIGFFLIYWAFLIGGEDLADRRIVTPIQAMWAPNVLIGLTGVFLIWKAVKETSFIQWNRFSKFISLLSAPKTRGKKQDAI